MIREFVIMPEFEKQWKIMGLDDEDLRFVQEQLIKNPKSGSVIQGTGGLRKLRIAFKNKGKSGSGRLLYVDFMLNELIYLIYAYPKSESDNLTMEQRNNIKKMIKCIEDTTN